MPIDDSRPPLPELLLLSALHGFTREHHYLPTIRELADRAGLKPALTWQRLRRLETMGSVRRTHPNSRPAGAYCITQAGLYFIGADVCQIHKERK